MDDGESSALKSTDTTPPSDTVPQLDHVRVIIINMLIVEYYI